MGWLCVVCLRLPMAIGEMFANKLTRNNKNKTDVVELIQATKEVKRNVVWED